MKIHHSLEDLPTFRNAVITFGSFDGVHLGHGELVELMKSEAASIDGETIVVTFEPHPRQIIYPGAKDLKLLSTKDEKIHLFKRLGVDHLVFCPFTVEFSQISADEYITKEPVSWVASIRFTAFAISRPVIFRRCSMTRSR